MNEEELFTEYKASKERMDSITQKIEQYFFPLAKQYIQRGDLAGAKEVLSRCPDNLTRCFIADAIRVAEGCYD